jgi:hypothetical protein
LSYPEKRYEPIFAGNKKFRRVIAYENKSKVIGVCEDMDCNLSIDHNVSLPVWGSVIRSALVSENILADYFFGSLDRVCGYANRRFHCPADRA